MLCINNKNVGIYNTSNGCLFTGNICHNNGSAPNSNFNSNGNTITGNYILNASSAFGPIVNLSTGGDISTTVNSDHPFANFEY